MSKITLATSKNSKFFDLIVRNIFFSEKTLKKKIISTDPFYSDYEKNLKENINKIDDERCLGYINAYIKKDKKNLLYMKLHREQGNLKARLIRNYSINDDLIIINTAGGLTSGDVNFNSIKISNDVVLNITTQSMEKVYKCKNLLAHTYTNITIGSDSYVSWMPLETIFFNGGKLRRRINIDLELSSNFLGIETIIFGRKAMGEKVKKGFLDDAWQINKNGKLLYSDFNRIDGNIDYKLSNNLVMQGNNILCNIIYTGRKMKVYNRKILKVINKSKYFAGVSIVNEVMLLKVLAKDINEIRAFLDKFMDILDNNFNLPKIWSF